MVAPKIGASIHKKARCKRGDRREPTFRDDTDRKRFLETLGEACARTGWQVHALCLMSNHFHLVVETPQGNLVAGMKWFLGYAEYLKPPARRWPWLRGDGWLGEMRLPKDSAACRREFERQMETRRGQEGGEEEWAAIRRGWFLGDEALKAELLAQASERVVAQHYGAERQESGEVKAERLVREEVAKLGRRRGSWPSGARVILARCASPSGCDSGRRRRWRGLPTDCRWACGRNLPSKGGERRVDSRRPSTPSPREGEGRGESASCRNATESSPPLAGTSAALGPIALCHELKSAILQPISNRTVPMNSHPRLCMSSATCVIHDAILGVLLGLLALTMVPSSRAQSAVARLVTTFSNPSPAPSDNFGVSVAAFGTDRVLIGAYADDTGATDAGTVYLFSLGGTLLATITNPAPAANETFGHSLTAVGTDRVLIGAPHDRFVGAAHLFNTNGTLLTTITNPALGFGGQFGISVAAVGTDRMLIGAHAESIGAANSGAAYLFSTNGTLLNTFTNPTPADFDVFGSSVAAVGSDRVLIGAGSERLVGGTAYLFSTNGALLTTFTNPMPVVGDRFGNAVAAVGTDMVLIAAPIGPSDGAAYLFRTNGTLLTTFTNPAPGTSYEFGTSVAAMGTDRVLIGTPYDSTGNTGAAYLFNTNGTLLTTITNPTPSFMDPFGEGFSLSVAAVGTHRVLIGAWEEDTDALDSGAVYLYALSGPPLQITRQGSQAVISWSTGGDFQLESTETLPGTGNWSAATTAPVLNMNTLVVTNDASGPAKFYRLRGP